MTGKTADFCYVCIGRTLIFLFVLFFMSIIWKKFTKPLQETTKCWDRSTDLSLSEDQSYRLPPISLSAKACFHASNRRWLLSEFDLGSTIPLPFINPRLVITEPCNCGAAVNINFFLIRVLLQWRYETLDLCIVCGENPPVL
jgi:hypothetical protein